MSDGAATELFVFAVPAVARSLRNSVYLFYNFRCSSLHCDTLHKIDTGLYSLANIPIKLCVFREFCRLNPIASMYRIIV